MQCNAIQYNTIQYKLQYNTIRYNTLQYDTIQYNTIQYITLQYNAIRYNTQPLLRLHGNYNLCWHCPTIHLSIYARGFRVRGQFRASESTDTCPERSVPALSSCTQHARIFFLRRSSIGGVAYVTYVFFFNSSATWTATFRLRVSGCILVIFVFP